MEKIKVIDVRAIPADSAFLLDDGKTAILYDSGFGFTGYAVADKIKEHLGNRNLDYIFLTHSHYDHVLGSAYALKYWPEAKVVAGEYAVQIFAKDSAKKLMRELDRKFANRCGVANYEDLVDELRVDVPVTDGDIIKAGDLEFMAVDLPGHTRCSVGFYCAEHRLLLGSETLGVYDGDGGIVPSYLVGYQMVLDSIAKAEQLNVDHILAPHYGLLNKDETKIYLNEAKNSAQQMAENIVNMLRAGNSREDIIEWFKQRYYHGYIKTIYPVDAMELNVGISIDLLKRELL